MESSLKFLLSIALILQFGIGASGLLIAYIFALLITIIPMFKRSGIELPGIKGSVETRSNIPMFLKYGMPLIGVNLASWILNLSDRYLIHFFYDVEQVGIYAANYDFIFRSVNYLFTFFYFVAAPIVMKLWETKGLEDTQRFLRDYFLYLMIVICPIVLFSLSYYEIIGTVFLNERYHDGIIIMPYVILGSLFFSLQQLFQYPFLFKKMTKYIFYFMLFAAIINVILNIFLIPLIGIVAAAITTLISSIVLLLLMVWYSTKIFNWLIPYKKIAYVFLIGVISISSSLIINHYILTSLNLPNIITLIISFTICILVYTGFLSLLKIINLKEIIKLIPS